MVTGGCGYLVFSSRAATRDIMEQAVVNYVTAQSPNSPAIQGRINCTATGPPLARDNAIAPHQIDLVVTAGYRK